MQFKDIEGQRVLINHLTQIADSGHVSHAQLFLGDTVSGSLALTLAYAQYLGCANRQHFPGADPQHDLVADSCGHCPHCQKYQQLAHPDLHLFFPTANIPNISDKPSSLEFLTQFREFLIQYRQLGTLPQWYASLGVENAQGILREADAEDMLRVVSMKSYENGGKVIVIWMAEKMQEKISNKLLKVLEEPLGDTLFLLVAENTETILPTIISRTQLVRVPSLERAGMDHFSPDLLTRFAPFYVDWMRMLFKLNMEKLNAWVNEAATLGREWQRQFLLFSLDSTRQCFLANMAGIPLSRSFGDAKFDSSFPKMVSSLNVEGFEQAFDKALYAIERNANPKITFMELSFKLSKQLKKR